MFYLETQSRMITRKFRSGTSVYRRERAAARMRAWLRWCFCSECLRGGGGGGGKGGDAKGLLPSASADDLPRKETCYYSYNVRRISRFGRAESKDGLQWSGEEGDEDSVSVDPRGDARSESRSVDSGVTLSVPQRGALHKVPAREVARTPSDEGVEGGGRRAPWFKRMKKRARSPRHRLPSELAASTPDLAQMSSAAGVMGVSPRSAQTLRVPGRGFAGLGLGLGLGASSGCLPRLPGAASADRPDAAGGGDSAHPRGAASYDGQAVRWTRSQSMESVDLSIEPSTPLADDVFQEDNTKTLAKSVGLNISLYSLSPSTVSNDPAMSKSTSKLLLWPPSKSEQKPDIKVESSADAKGDISIKVPKLPSTAQPLNTEDFIDLPCGSVTFTASYLQKNKRLCIQLNKLENLPPKGKNSVYDVVVRLCILPAEKHVKTSKILRGSLSPVTEEDFTFSMKETAGKVVRFSVFNALLQGKHDAIGHALFNVEDLMSGRSRRYNMKLSHQSQLEPSFGSLQVYLQLTQERLTVDTIQARNLSVSHILKGSRSSEKFNTYMKVTFYCAGQKVKSKKSPVVTGGRNPRYEYSCDFKIISNYLDDCYIVLSLVLKVNLRKDVTLGRYILGPHFFSESSELTPWGRVVLNREEVHHWFRLYL